ncbi:MAG: DNA mismatch repair endonuclease MutL [Chloroflexota bacterium]|nr:DNA mismatch repair endonuclease MutL [Dehalococcoidia bacterium]MDW8252424.1 DNA mismatch repair endonuclease MutL [Chloroflexota bacterium]
MPIRVLEPALAARIAAGEVIERPASVVKELIENALDAGARSIGVEIRGGGIQLIRVTDDGCGIAEAEIELAFERHATSKLTTLDDLETIATLGFRGEALPSIRAVAEVSIVSRPADQPYAAVRRWERGALVEASRQAGAPGTQITVRRLFADLPARRQHLRSAATEAAACAQVVSQYALARPAVRFTLQVDGRTTLRAPGTGALEDAVVATLGRAAADAMVPVDSRETAPDPLTQVVGLVGRPSVSRANRGGLSFFINGRWVQSRLLAQAVESAFQNRLMVGRHPLAVLHLAIAPGGVDVNVHPAKSEVRLRFEREVFSVVQRAVRAALDADLRLPEVVPAPPLPWPDDGPAEQLPLAVPLARRLPALRLLGQVGLTYLIAEGPDGIYLVDQHAAHERILFERLLAAWERGAVERQGLLDPVVLDLSLEQLIAYERHADQLAALGLTVDRFGERSVVVRAAPASLAPGEVSGAVMDALTSLIGNPAEWRDRIAASIACHSAIRAGQALSDAEMRALLSQLEETAAPKTCPHGRPTMMHLSATQLARLFGRLG